MLTKSEIRPKNDLRTETINKRKDVYCKIFGFKMFTLRVCVGTDEQTFKMVSCVSLFLLGVTEFMNDV